MIKKLQVFKEIKLKKIKRLHYVPDVLKLQCNLLKSSTKETDPHSQPEIVNTETWAKKHLSDLGNASQKLGSFELLLCSKAINRRGLLQTFLQVKTSIITNNHIQVELLPLLGSTNLYTVF